MEEEAIATTTYWCHMCSRTVNPLMEAEIKCPFCASGFVEEMPEEEEHSPDTNSLWAPILMQQLMNDHALRTSNQSTVEDNQNEVDSQLQEILRRRRGRHSVSLVRLSLHGVVGGSGSTLESDGDDTERGRVIMVPGGSLSEYFIGPGFEALLQRLAENDPNRYGTPPARKEAVESLATVKIQEEASLQCSVCLDDFEIGMEAKEMPCKHKFHGDCLLPWLELHSSCPVCRYELPSDETKTSADSATNDNNGVNESSSSTSSQGSETSHPEQEEEEEEENDDGDGIEFSIPWLFSSLFSSSRSSSNPSTDTN
ncbi:hypothetical protein N665_0827s0020 [Sinapis alba]|nr:hypothetical protein N665_0827s0020 [Sinapis alba]